MPGRHTMVSNRINVLLQECLTALNTYTIVDNEEDITKIIHLASSKEYIVMDKSISQGNVRIIKIENKLKKEL